ncbi:hypothetical protein MYOV003v1_p0201 [Vibrio phage 207E48.1]|nr:hypothetical protein MYOV003v1_p0201 [Vibrio phage 207E48.1]
MPMYDYQCGDCSHTFTSSRRISERKKPESEPCPECGDNAVSMIIGSPRIVGGVGDANGKVPQGFKDVLKNIKKGSGKDCTIDV